MTKLRTWIFLRNKIMVKDICGNNNIPVAFYRKTGNIKFHDLKKGNVLCMRYQEKHSFIDMTIGIRAENLEYFMIIPASLNCVLSVSDDLYKNTSDNKCWKCNLSNKLSVCSKCKIAKYCNKECQVEHWKIDHKLKCNVYNYVRRIESVDYSKFTTFIPF